ncbi:MAG: two-component system response regulator, partial [Azospira oryzae]
MSTPAAGLSQEQASSSLLLVDDEPYILSALQRLLRPLSYRIFTATGGAAGLEILERERIDLIISDMRMPEMDGAQFLAQVAKRWPDTLRILLTGYADLPSAIAAINQGRIYCYVSKPWEDNDLKLIIARALEHLHTQREKERLEALTRAQNEELKALNASLEEKVKARTAELEQVMQMLEASYASLKKGYSATIPVFSHLIEAR